MKRLAMLTGLIAVVAAMPATAKPGMGHGLITRYCLRAANVQLTQAQRDKLRTLRDEMRLNRDKLMPKFRELKKRVLKAFANPSLSDAQVKKVMQDARKSRQKLMNGFVDRMIKLRHILTPEQLKKIANTPACLQMKGRGQGHGCPGMGRGMGKGMGRGMRGKGMKGMGRGNW